MAGADIAHILFTLQLQGQSFRLFSQPITTKRKQAGLVGKVSVLKSRMDQTKSWHGAWPVSPRTQNAPICG